MRPRSGAPLALRIPLAVIVLTVIVLAVADISVALGLRSFMVSRIDEQLVQLADVAPQLLSRPVSDGDDDHDGQLEPISDARIAIPGAVAALRLPSGLISWAAAPNSQNQNPSALLADAGSIALNTPTTFTLDGNSVRVLRTENQGLQTAVMLPLEPVEEASESLVKLEIIIGGIAIVVLGLGTLVLVRRGLRPLQRMSAAAEVIASTDLTSGYREITETVRKSGDPTELARLGDSFDEMTEHINDSLAIRDASELKLRQFVSDASHELRTPLQSIRGYAELTRRGMAAPEELPQLAARIEDESIRMGGIVDDLLLLARLDQGRPLAREQVDVVSVINDVVSDSLAADPDRHISVSTTAPSIKVIGDANRLHQVLVNLVTNARVHTPNDAAIAIYATQDEQQVTIAISDTGEGMPDAVREKIFDRFYRSDAGRSRDRGGSGLGLAIVKSVVEAHGGSVSVTSSEQGTTFTLVLPNS